MKYTSLSLVLIAASASIAAKPLPVVDLGYVQQRATWYKSTTGIFAYKNIRYARPPIGEWRFQKPQLPLHEAAGTISDGSQYGSTICPQIATNATPSASGYSEDCLVSFLATFWVQSRLISGLVPRCLLQRSSQA